MVLEITFKRPYRGTRSISVEKVVSSFLCCEVKFTPWCHWRVKIASQLRILSPFSWKGLNFQKNRAWQPVFCKIRIFNVTAENSDYDRYSICQFSISILSDRYYIDIDMERVQIRYDDTMSNIDIFSRNRNYYTSSLLRKWKKAKSAPETERARH